jgi:hypothetical protein
MVELCGRICIFNCWDDAGSLKGALKKRQVFSITVWMGKGKKQLLFFFIQMESVINEVDLELV